MRSYIGLVYEGTPQGKQRARIAKRTLERFSELTVWKAPEGLKWDSSLARNQNLGMPRNTSVQQTHNYEWIAFLCMDANLYRSEL